MAVAGLNAVGSTPAATTGIVPRPDIKKAREAFDTFVGETFYGQMLKAMRQTVDKPAYCHGGRAEEVFQGQFDQVIAQKLAKADARSFTGPMFDQYLRQLGRQ